MKKVATHDSATGEKGRGFLSWIGTPFARTQSKTIREQYEAGCRMFDIRVKLVKGQWRCAHGLWISKRLATNILKEINSFKGTCYVTLTYEGGNKYKEEFINFVDKVKNKYTYIKWGAIAFKYAEGDNIFKVSYDYLYHPKKWPKCVSKFLPLNGSTWHILIPIPWLWKKVYYDNPIFNDDFYTYVDFL